VKDKTKKRIDTYNKAVLVTATKINQTCDNSLRVKLKRGHSYIIVPSPKVACKVDQEFFLSFYMSYDISHVNLERVDKEQRYEFITEEYEAAMR